MKKLFTGLIIFVAFGIMWIALETCFPDTRNCQVVYDIMKELKSGMSKDEVLAIIKKHDKPYIFKSYKLPEEAASPQETKDEYISIRVNYALADSLILGIRFRNNKLYMTKIRGENGTETAKTFKGAPPEILPEKQAK